MNYQTLHLIGHGLGAHTAGYVGQALYNDVFEGRRPGRITGEFKKEKQTKKNNYIRDTRVNILFVHSPWTSWTYTILINGKILVSPFKLQLYRRLPTLRSFDGPQNHCEDTAALPLWPSQTPKCNSSFYFLYKKNPAMRLWIKIRQTQLRTWRPDGQYSGQETQGAQTAVRSSWMTIFFKSKANWRL